jgi:hypothetical protein
MELAAIIVIVVVVAVVAVDAIARLDERPRSRKRHGDAAVTTTQKIIVDLTKRR